MGNDFPGTTPCFWLFLSWLVGKRGSVNLRPAQVHADAAEHGCVPRDVLPCPEYCAEREPAPEVLTHTGASNAEILGNVPFLDFQKRLLELKATRDSPASGPANAKS